MHRKDACILLGSAFEPRAQVDGMPVGMVKGGGFAATSYGEDESSRARI